MYEIQNETSKNWSVRWAIADDLDDLVQASAYVSKGLMSQDKGDWYGGNDAEEFQEVLAAGTNAGCVIAEAEEKIIGYLVLNTHNEATCHKRLPVYQIGEGLCVDGMGVIPECREQGVLSDMLKFAQNYAVAIGKKYLYGTVFPENYPSICSFDRNSSWFRVSDETESYQMKDGRILIRKYFLAKI